VYAYSGSVDVKLKRKDSNGNVLLYPNCLPDNLLQFLFKMQKK
jgi:hypothetical protein